MQPERDDAGEREEAVEERERQRDEATAQVDRDQDEAAERRAADQEQREERLPRPPGLGHPHEEGDEPGSGDERDRYRVKHKLQRLEEETMHLAAEVAKGKGMAETTPSVEEIGVLARDLRELLARMYVMSPLQQRVDAARALWRELLPYYGIEPPADAPPKAS